MRADPLAKPLAESFTRDFGIASPAYRLTHEVLMEKLEELRDDSELRVKRSAWNQSIQMAYGSLETDDALFAKHTYLAIFARLLIWAALERKRLSADDLDSVLNGRYFVRRGILNLVEDDFFRWHEIPSPTDVHHAWLALAEHLARYDLSSVREDVLKPLYEELVDPATRQVLGEFYTPDWLADRLTRRLLSSWSWEQGTPSILDPSCGSGTFLRSAIQCIRQSLDERGAPQSVDEILNRVVGLDVHPLAVTIARATYLLAVRDLVDMRSGPIKLPVYLANSLHAERDAGLTLFGAGSFSLQIEDRTFNVPVELVHDAIAFDSALDDVLAVSEAYGRSEEPLITVSRALQRRIGGRLDMFPEPSELRQTLGSLAEELAARIRSRRDSVFGFLLRNNYRPATLRRSFDYVIGNPPWLTVGDIATGDYKSLVIRLATHANIAPRDVGEQSHTELATIFLSQATEFLSRDEGVQGCRIGFVMPRSLFSASHHRLLREGAYSADFAVRELWDLEGVAPLFRVPACVVIAEQAPPEPRSTIDGRVFVGRLPTKEMGWELASKHLSETDTSYVVRFLGERSAWVRVNEAIHFGNAWPTRGANHYAAAFRQGAILYPQTLLTVVGVGRLHRGMGPVRVTTDPRSRANAKLLRDIAVNHLVESENLFTTAAAEHLVPYSLTSPLSVVVLPTLRDPNEIDFRPVGPDELRNAGRINTARWLEWANAQWAAVRKPGETKALHERLDYLGQLTAQAGRSHYVVLYTSSGSRPVAAAISTQDFDLPFVIRDNTYWAAVDSPEQGDFLAAFLNSNYVAHRIEDWQTRGLFGPRHVHKRPLDVAWPAFDPMNAEHVELAAVSRELCNESAQLAADLGRTTVASQRAEIRSRLDGHMLQRSEELVAAISEARTVAIAIQMEAGAAVARRVPVPKAHA